ncbi:MAG TPA: hypothetical protein VNF24_11000 [Candidatus Acidoferrales bacterium]|nr:hypothetical protein [Candidatus Acidoferrales bacterium]
MPPAAPPRGEPAIEVVDLRRTYRTTTGPVRRRRRESGTGRGNSLRGEPGKLFGLLGLVLGATFVRYRSATALSSALGYPVWPVCGPGRQSLGALAVVCGGLAGLSGAGSGAG